MAATAQTRPTLAAQDTRFDRRLAEILDFATEVFAEKGYEGASMRDLSRLSGISLAGLYYYFDSKEKLLYFIQRHTFSTIIGRLRERLARECDAEKRLRVFVHNHVDYALARHDAMKVLSHEDEVLRNSYRAELAAIKREYYQICVALVDDVLQQESPATATVPRIRTRTAVMALFGTMNWLYTWHNPRVDPGAEALAQQITDLFLRGIRGETTSRRPVRSRPRPKQTSRMRQDKVSRSAHE